MMPRSSLVDGITGLFSNQATFHTVSYIRQHAKPGDILEFHRGVYSHYALYLGDSKVMNIDTEDKKNVDALICERTLQVCGESKVRIRNRDSWETFSIIAKI